MTIVFQVFLSSCGVWNLKTIHADVHERWKKQHIKTFCKRRRHDFDISSVKYLEIIEETSAFKESCCTLACLKHTRWHWKIVSFLHFIVKMLELQTTIERLPVPAGLCAHQICNFNCTQKSERILRTEWRTISECWNVNCTEDNDRRNVSIFSIARTPIICTLTS